MRPGTDAACVAVCLVSVSCGGYRDFTLPAQARPATGEVQLSWSVRPEPVLPRGDRGEWDDVDALNPSVLRTAAGYFNFYSGYDGQTWHTGLAISHDGIAWNKRGRVMSPDPRTWEGDYIAANGSVLEIDGEFWHWYQAGRNPRIGLARSKTGMRWAKEAAPVLPLGPRGSWDERGVGDPYVVRFENTLYMYYLGQDRARRQRLGVAMSTDGVQWFKLRSNPILDLGAPGEFDEVGLGEPAVWSNSGSYWMLYTARDRNEKRHLGLARSQDGVNWRRVSDRPALSGAHAWNAEVVCDPSVALSGAEVQVWFGGGDRAEPAENLNGQIGFATLAIGTGTLAK